MAHEPQHSEITSGAPPSSEPAGFSADAALILAALSRIGTVVRDEQAALKRLRAALADMAQAIANAKTVADSETAAAMLDEFEHRVDAMIELAGGSAVAAEVAAMPEPAEAIPAEASEPAAAPAADSDQVPTVSGVVLRLGPGDEAPPQAAEEPAPPDELAADQGPTVAMLTAMVEALSASIQTPATVEAPAAEPAALPDNAAEHETALLASFERMETRPFPPPEEGTAVIFSPRPMAEPIADVAPEVPVPEPEQAIVSEPVPEQAFAPEPMPEPTAPAAMELEAAPPMPEPAAAVDTDFDPTDFLFGPEPEPDPAESLLDPTPQPGVSRAVLLPQPEFVSPSPEPPDPPEAEQPQAMAPAPVAEEPEPAPAPHDPLHALKAMTPEERLAIFS
jgi:hypothetical protein